MRTVTLILLHMQLFAWSLASTHEDLTINSTQLYDYINESLYDEAVTLTKKLKDENQEVVIMKTVHDLLDSDNKNIVDYAFKLWESDEQQIVRLNFPKSFQFLFNKHNVRIVNRKYDIPLFEYTTVYGEVQVWGAGCYKEPKLLLWRMKPIWDNNRVYFKINNVEGDNNLSLSCLFGDNAKALAEEDSSGFPNSALWSFEPMWNNNKMYFRFINKECEMALKLYTRANNRKDRIALGDNGVYNKDDGPVDQWYLENKVSITNEIDIDIRK